MKYLIIFSLIQMALLYGASTGKPLNSNDFDAIFFENVNFKGK